MFQQQLPSTTTNPENSIVSHLTKPCCSSKLTISKIHECPHLKTFKENGGIESFHATQQYIQTTKFNLIERNKIPTPYCFACTSQQKEKSFYIRNSFQRLHICLQCIFIGCWKESHAMAHFKQATHFLALDVESAGCHIYCFACGDYVYDSDMEVVMQIERTNARVSAKRKYGGDCVSANTLTFTEWLPTRIEAELMNKSSKRLVTPSHLLGVRGLNNLGNTCFMNSILQCFVHNPLIRNYFLSDIHNRKICSKHRNENQTGTNGSMNNSNSVNHSNGVMSAITSNNTNITNNTNNNSNTSGNTHGNGISSISNSNNNTASSPAPTVDNNTVCFACEMDFLFSHMYSGMRSPFSPHHFLYSVWKSSPNYFAGYEQQDAHEFMISALNGIHSHCNTFNTTEQDKECSCVIHQVFNGILRSDVTCNNCGTTSTAFDPFFDISVDLKHSKKGVRDELSESAGDVEQRESLFNCLNRFTRPEKLGNAEKFLCHTCNTYQDSVKQFSMQALPLVMCFHIKRFEQAATKIDAFVEFPEVLDLSPYLSANIHKFKRDSDSKSIDLVSDVVEIWPKTSTEQFGGELYELFGVVNHHGNMDNGHYTCFVRHANVWLKCDDSWITKASLQQVLNSKGYVLFYMKKHLDYYKGSIK